MPYSDSQSVRIRDATYHRLLNYAAKLTQQKGKRVSMSDAIENALDIVEAKSDVFNFLDCQEKVSA